LAEARIYQRRIVSLPSIRGSKTKMESVYAAQHKSIGRSWRNMFYRDDRRSLCPIYFRRLGASAHTRSELE